MFQWGILLGVALTLVLGGIGKAALAAANKKWFKKGS